MTTKINDKLTRNQLFVVLKIAEVCNLKCPYCYFFFGGDESYKDDPKKIPADVVQSTAAFLGQGAKDLDLRRIDISLHGGEPLMVGKKRFEKICETLRAINPGETELGLNIQTNGVLIDDDWVDIFRKFDIGVGVSIDGPKHIHDRYRIDMRGRGTYDETKRGIEKMRAGKVAIGALAVVSKELTGREMYDHVVRELGIRSLDFLFPIQNWDDFDPELTDQVTRFYEDLLDAWIEDDNPRVEIRTLSDRLRAMLSDQGMQRRTLGLKDICDSITIRSNGDLCPDDTLQSIRSEYRYTGYSVHSSGLAEFMAADFWGDLRRSTQERSGRCVDCKWWGICRGGDSEHRYATGQGFSRESTYCDTYKRIFQQLYDRVVAVMPPDTVNARLADAELA
jgi:uncharacterized protein